jgi:ketosteroid isomerase-like protein
MPNTRREVLATGAGLAALGIASATPGASLARSSAPDAVAELVQRSADAHAALMRGDVDTYRRLVSYTDDFTLMTPFGGKPSHRSDLTPERIEAMRHFFKNGTFRQEVVQSYSSADMVVLALIERQHVEVGGLPAQDWALRVTLVYRREGSEWRLAIAPIRLQRSRRRDAIVARQVHADGVVARRRHRCHHSEERSSDFP